MQTKTLALPRLNNLSPTLESTALKLMEETGELAQALGKLRGLSGEAIICAEKDVMAMVARELLDVAQTAISLMFVLEEQYGVDVKAAMEAHLRKLFQKGYLKE
jgi:NTP pyrophosphatase (non-canonical NTP hydrolase)